MIVFYLSGAGAYLFFLLVKFLGDSESDLRDVTSWLVIAIASSLWFVVIPISLWEIKSKAKSNTTPTKSKTGSKAEKDNKTTVHTKSDAQNILSHHES
ncbi:hypothetical protein IQ255_05450 [Pleurocapsales cyanobacterium LEGE 10410]|nr:hypothetical protein [Pleurocapsales cyanobacterium LEGE 10410]